MTDRGVHEQRFRNWWKRDTPGFEVCTLTQAIGAYLSTYPGRILPLLVELLRTPDDPPEPPEPKARSFTSEP